MPLHEPPPLPDNLRQILGAAQNLVLWIAEHQDGIETGPDHKIVIPGLLYDLTIEHHASIVHLAAGRMNGSAFALLRAAFETLIRGAWLQLCSSPDELKTFVEKDRLPRNLEFGDMVSAIEQHSHFADMALSHLKHHSWRAMNSYTHGGMLQVSRRINGKSIEPMYEPDEVIEVLKAAGTFALIALRQIANLAQDEALEREVERKLTGETRL